jgi:hypothetical protein
VNSTEQWSPLKGVSRDSVLSWGIACNACVKQLDADLSGSHGYHQKLRYANTKTLSSYSIGLFKWEWDRQMFLSKHLRGAASAPFQLCWPFLSAIHGTSSSLCSCISCKTCRTVHFEDFLLESFSGFLKIFHPKYLAASEYSSMEIQPLKGPMEHWGSGIAWGFHCCTQDCNVSCHVTLCILQLQQIYHTTNYFRIKFSCTP